jgi:hypothetical protein
LLPIYGPGVVGVAAGVDGEVAGFEGAAGVRLGNGIWKAGPIVGKVKSRVKPVLGQILKKIVKLR